MSSSPSPAPASRRELARTARDAFPPMGIYLVRDKEAGVVHVASSRHVHAAINRAQFELRFRSHANKALQAAWNAGGADRIAFEVVDLLREREDAHFDYAEELRGLERLYREQFGLPADDGGRRA